MNISRLFLLLALVAALCCAAVVACGDDDDDDSDDAADDDDNDTADDDTTDDDDTTPGDDDDATPGDDDDDDTPDGPAPLLDGLTLLPDEGFAGDNISMSFHWQDLEGDVNGGEVTLYIDGAPMTTFTAITAGGTSGFVDFSFTLADDIGATNLLIEVAVMDLAGNTSNKVGQTFKSFGGNTAPEISNLRFDPDPACTTAGEAFTILFDYFDAEANLDGGTVSILINEQFPPIGGTLTGSGPPSGTFGLQLAFTDTVPDGAEVNFIVQFTDNRGLASDSLTADLTFLDSACTE
jgi:hypothetical protein